MADVLHHPFHIPQPPLNVVHSYFPLVDNFLILPFRARKTLGILTCRVFVGDSYAPESTKTQKSSEIINHQVPAYHFDWINFSSAILPSTAVADCTVPSETVPSNPKKFRSLFVAFVSHSPILPASDFHQGPTTMAVGTLEECFRAK